MTQFEFDMICKIIQNGAPALASDLIGSISNLINDANALLKERDELKAELERRDSECSKDASETPTKKAATK